jgi:hypothetical protein
MVVMVGEKLGRKSVMLNDLLKGLAKNFLIKSELVLETSSSNS